MTLAYLMLLLFVDIENPPQKDMQTIVANLGNLRQIWELTRDWLALFQSWKTCVVALLFVIAYESLTRLAVLNSKCWMWRRWTATKEFFKLQV